MKFSWRAALIILAVVIAAVAILPPAVTQARVSWYIYQMKRVSHRSYLATPTPCDKLAAIGAPAGPGCPRPAAGKK